MKKITVGLFIDTYYPLIDGVINVVDNYARRLGKYCNVVVFCPYNKEPYDDFKLPYKVERCKSIQVPTIDYSLPLPDLDKKFKEIVKGYNLDIVHIHSPFTLGKLAIRYAKKHNIPCVGTMHSQFEQDFKRTFKVNRLAKKINKKFVIDVFNECDECWAVNGEVARIFHEDYGYKCMPKVMGNATDMVPVNKKEADKYVNAKHNLKPTTKVFLFVGRINKLKNIFFIADSLRLLDDKLDYKCLFIGGGQDDEEFRDYIKKNKMDNIIMVGKVSDRKIIAEYYKRADLFLFPSLYDASSLVQIEAASQGTPTVFLEGAATASTVTNGVNGLTSKNSIKAYAKCILDIMNDKDKYDEISANALNDLYVTWDEKVEEVFYEYERLIEEKKNKA